MESNGESTAHGWNFEAKSRDFGSGEIRQLPQVRKLFPGKKWAWRRISTVVSAAGTEQQDSAKR